MSRRTRLAVTVITLLALAALATPAYAAPKPKATVSGTVYGSDGVAVSGATVGVYLANKQGVYNWVATLTTNSSGSWSYGGKGGDYRFDFAAPSADPQSRWLTMADGSTYTLDATLQSYGSLAGSVIDAATGVPLAGAMVELYLRNPDGSWPPTPQATLATAADGSYASGQVPAGRYAVKASAAGYVTAYHGGPTLASATPVFVYRGAALVGINVALAAENLSGTISGRVVQYATEVPVRNAFVWLYKQNADGTWPPTTPGWGSPSYTVYTNSLGTYTSGALPLGNYKVRFFTSMTGSQWWEYVYTVDAATVVSLTYAGQSVTGIDGWFNKP